MRTLLSSAPAEKMLGPERRAKRMLRPGRVVERVTFMEVPGSS